MERALHSAEARAHTSLISAKLSPDFFEYGSSGKIWTRENVLEDLVKEDGSTRIESKDYKAKLLSKDVVLVTYISAKIKTGLPSVEFLRSSIWRKNADGWQIEFHQGTLRSR
jgi:hypothetical protein